MLFMPPVRADGARSDLFVRRRLAVVREFAAKLTISFNTVGFLANHNFQLIDRYHFAMRCFVRPLGGPRQLNTRGGES